MAKEKVEKLNKKRNSAPIPISARSRKKPFTPKTKKVKEDKKEKEVKEEVKVEEIKNEKIISKTKGNVRKVKVEEKTIKDIDVEEGVDNLLSEQTSSAKKMKEQEKDKRKKLLKQKRENKLEEEKKAAFIFRMNNLKKLNESEKKYTLSRAFVAMILGIVIIVFNLVVIFGYGSIDKKLVEILLKIISMAFILITITIFEFAYHKDDGKLAMIGTEVLVLSIFILVSIYIFILYESIFKLYLVIGTVVITFYYLIKMIMVVIKSKNDHNKNISDVKEIVKEEEEIEI